MLGGGNYGGGSMNSVSLTGLGQNPAFYDTLLTGLASEMEPVNHRFYHDIYQYDTTAGACVDLMSVMPFSDFDLTGVDDKRLEVYNSAIEQLNLKTYFQEATVDYLTYGYTVASLMYDSKAAAFTDMISHPPSMCELTPVPMRSRDPLIRVKQSDDLRAFMFSDDDRVRKLRSKINSNVLDALKSGEMELDPVSTLFMARKTFSFDDKGTSMFRRLLPIYFLEKTLYKGTVVEAGRRQRSLLHLAVGDDTWEPMVEELQAIVALFQQADMDPLGAIIATRMGVNPNELRQGGDFWKWTDIIDILQPAKMRAMGISESFLSGDATFNNMETGLSVFMENQQSYRARATHVFLYNKILPLIAAINDFEKKPDNDKGKVKEEGRTSVFRGIKMLKEMNDRSRWDLPTVNWQKSLGKDTDSGYMDVLDKMGAAGIPVPLRMYAVAGGMDIDSLEDDLKKEVDMKKRWEKIVGKPIEAEDEEGGGNSEFSSYFGFPKRRAILGRNFGDASEITGFTKTGQRKYIPNQRAASEEANLKIAKAAVRIQDPHVHMENLKRVIAARGAVPDLYNGGSLGSK